MTNREVLLGVALTISGLANLIGWAGFTICSVRLAESKRERAEQEVVMKQQTEAMRQSDYQLQRANKLMVETMMKIDEIKRGR